MNERVEKFIQAAIAAETYDFTEVSFAGENKIQKWRHLKHQLVPFFVHKR